MTIFKKATSFVSEVRHEVRHVTWPSRREVSLTTVMIFIFTAIASLYFAFVDTILYRTLNFIINS